MKSLLKRVTVTSLTMLSFTASVAFSAEEQQSQPQQSVDTEKLLKTCQAATWDAQQAAKQEKKSKKGPVRRAVRSSAKFLANEANATAQGIGRDMVFIFSAQDDVDPYAGKAPTTKPYEAASFRLVDGTMCSVMKYPDMSARVDGGFADGTIIAPMGNGKFIVGYPNGARGTMVKSGTSVKIYRPDKTVTTFEKTLSGNYKIHNSSVGYMGEGITDQTGLRYDFGSFGKGTF